MGQSVSHLTDSKVILAIVTFKSTKAIMKNQFYRAPRETQCETTVTEKKSKSSQRVMKDQAKERWVCKMINTIKA